MGGGLTKASICNERLLTLDIVRNALSRFGGYGDIWEHLHLWADDVQSFLDLFAVGLAGRFSPNGAFHVRRDESPQPPLSHFAAEFAVANARKTKGGPLWEMADVGTWLVIEHPPVVHALSVGGVQYTDTGIRVLQYYWKYGLWLLYPEDTPEAAWNLQQLAPGRRVEPAPRSRWVRPWSIR